MNTLNKLITQVGEEAFSCAVGVSIYTVRAYRYGKRIPSNLTAKKILAVYGKMISYEGIYGKPE